MRFAESTGFFIPVCNSIMVGSKLIRIFYNKMTLLQKLKDT